MQIELIKKAFSNIWHIGSTQRALAIVITVIVVIENVSSLSLYSS